MAASTRYVVVNGRKIYLRHDLKHHDHIFRVDGNKAYIDGIEHPIYDDGEGTKIEGPEVDFDKAARIDPNAEWNDDDRSLWK